MTPPPLKASRVKDIVVEELVLSTKVKTHSRSPAEQKTTKGEIMFYALLTDGTVTMASPLLHCSLTYGPTDAISPLLVSVIAISGCTPRSFRILPCTAVVLLPLVDEGEYAVPSICCFHCSRGEEKLICSLV